MANQTQQATREFDVVRFMQMYQKAQRLSPEAYGYLCGVIDFFVNSRQRQAGLFTENKTGGKHK